MKAARAVLHRDGAFRPLLAAVDNFELQRHRPHFWTLCSSILSQQVSGAAARTIIGRVRDLHPRLRYPSPEAILTTSEASTTGRGRNPWIEGDNDGLVAVENTKLEGMADFLLVDCSHTAIKRHPEAIEATVKFLETGAFRAK